MTNSTLSYAIELADQVSEAAMANNKALIKGLNIYKGKGDPEGRGRGLRHGL